MTDIMWRKKPALEIPERIARRAAHRYTVDAEGCWVSGYFLTPNGYAHVTGRDPETKEDHVYLAHRAAWTYYNGPIEEGHVIDHLCRNRRCVNPEHLRSITLFENSKRQSNLIVREGHCRWGHPDSERIPVKPWGYRTQKTECGACRQEKNDRGVLMKALLKPLEIAYGLGGHETKKTYAANVAERDARVAEVRAAREAAEQAGTDASKGANA